MKNLENFTDPKLKNQGSIEIVALNINSLKIRVDILHESIISRSRSSSNDIMVHGTSLRRGFFE